MRHLFVVLPALVAVSFAQDHFIDVRTLVRDTIDAIKEVPEMMKSQNQTITSVQPEVSTPEPQKVVKARGDVYDTLLKLPSDIMSQLARDAGFISEKDQKKQTEVTEKKKEEVERVEKKKEDEESYSFKTVDDIKAEQQKELNERPTLATKKEEDDEDIFSISKLISATGNAIREAQAAQAANAPPKSSQQQPQQEPMITLPPLVPLPPVPLQMPALQMPSTVAQPATEIMYRPVTKDGKTVYEQVVVLKEANGSVKILPNTLLPQLPEVPKRVEIKQVKSASDGAEFLAPTFPPMVNLFTDPTTTTTTTTTEEPEVTTTEEPEPVKPRRKSLPRRKIHYLEKKSKDMHSRQFGAKTVQMSDPIEIQAQEEQDPVNVLQKEGSVRVYTINRKRKIRKPRVVKVEENEKVEEEEPVHEETVDTTEPPKKKRKLRKSHKASKKEKKEKKEIRTFPDLYDEQWKTQVAPSVSPPSEDFAEQFDGVDEVQDSPKKEEMVQQEPQNDTPMNDALEQRSSKVQMFTKEQEEELLNKEIRKRVMHRIRLSKVKTSTTTTTEAPTTTPEEESEEEEIVKASQKEEDGDDVVEAEELVEDDEEETPSTTTTEAPVTRAQRVKKNKKRAVVTKHQCLNLRSFARQFLFDTVEEFAKEHCYFIENYYPALTCARSHLYVAKCQKWLKEE